MMDALTVVTQLRDLASKPHNQESILQDKACLSGLVLFLDHQDFQVVYCALQALRYLAEFHSSREQMKNELGMMVSLEKLTEQTDTIEEIPLLAKEVYNILNSPTADSLRTPEPPKRKMKQHFFINSSNKKAKSITLHIQGLDDKNHRGLCEEALLKVKGVISFTFQMALKRCTVRIRSDLPTEVYVPFGPAHAIIEENSFLPDYLPEEESPEKEVTTALARTGAKQEGAGGGGWLNAATNFLTKTFYW
ncbi:armadillo repeat containing 1, like isoform X2 [Erpetoichthys calabaricus]|uniref:armadillo repeat containing 1, like isoform X2 n=1 Tax=Erpetoichthys calabaricus TaxID=27687 RepID=UPI0022341E00|nr:armadillo repeat containing 1, like isoform X2 [Erpetoichthys calabaricus]